MKSVVVLVQTSKYFYQLDGKGKLKASGNNKLRLRFPQRLLASDDSINE